MDLRRALVELQVSGTEENALGDRRPATQAYRSVRHGLRDPVVARRAIGAALVAATLILLPFGTARVASAFRRCRPARTGAAGSLPLVDRCTGTLLVLRDRTGFGALDLDAGRSTRLGGAHVAGTSPEGATDAISRDHAAVLDSGSAFSVGLRGGRTFDLGPAVAVLPDGERGWWVIAPGGQHGLPGTVARRAVGDRSDLGQPLYLDAGVTPLAGVSRGLIVRSGAAALAVVGGPRPGPLRTQLHIDRVVATDRDTILVVVTTPAGRAELWTVDVERDTERRIGEAGQLPAAEAGAPAAKFSPDGRRLAVVVNQTSASGFRNDAVVVVDLPTGRVVPVPGGGTAAPSPALAWSPDGRWLFFVQAGGPVGRTMGAYRRGDRVAGALRYYPPGIVDLLAVRR